MSSEIKPKLIHRLKLGKLQVSLYGRPRQKPLFTEQAAALEQLKKAMLKELKPIFEPILEWMNPRLSKWDKWLDPVYRWIYRIVIVGFVLCFALLIFLLIKVYP